MLKFGQEFEGEAGGFRSKSLAADPEVRTRALAEDRLLITFDKDFGELVFRRGAKASQGVVLFRISQPSAAAAAERVAAVLASRDDWPGHFSIVDDFTIRIRRLP